MSKSDKELFRDYLYSKEADSSETIGKRYLAGRECFDMDNMMRNVVNSILYADPQPVEELDFLVEELTDLYNNVLHVKKGFIAYKAAQEAA